MGYCHFTGSTPPALAGRLSFQLRVLICHFLVLFLEFFWVMPDPANHGLAQPVQRGGKFGQVHAVQSRIGNALAQN